MAVLVRAKAIVTCDTDRPQNGITFADLGLIEDGFLLCENGRVTACGAASGAEALDFPNCIIVPGLVDAHTHPLYAGNREEDFRAHTQGAAPEQGMLHTVRATRKALEDPQSFWRLVEPRLRAMLAHGTTTAEVKTGYALTARGEFALLDLLHAHQNDSGIPRLVPTFLGAHALAPEFATFDAYVDYLIAECLPPAKTHGAVYADVFCEPGFFTPAQARRYLLAARDNGLRLRIHCDEMAHGGAALMASGLGVDAVDHCNVLQDADIDAVAGSGAVVVSCPTTIAYLDLPRRARVRELLVRGAMVALASDFDPGTSPCFNLQTVAHYGRKFFGLTAAEALYGVTIAAARSLRVQAGTLRPGAAADFVVLRVDSPEEFGWEFGGNLVQAVFRGGERVA